MREALLARLIRRPFQAKTAESAKHRARRSLSSALDEILPVLARLKAAMPPESPTTRLDHCAIRCLGRRARDAAQKSRVGLCADGRRVR